MESDRDALPSIASLTPTVCELLGVPTPSMSTESVLATVRSALAVESRPVERCLIFAPDAIGDHLWDSHGETCSRVLHYAPVRIALRSVVPPKTPVCFASIFTGGPPEAHGIREYTRPVLRCDTFFDAVLRAGKTVAIVAVRESSIDLIFRDRDLEYFSEDNDAAVACRAEEVIESLEFDVVVAYQQEYDDLLHRTSPRSSACIAALTHHVQAFETLAEVVRKHWVGYPALLVFAPDHGAHFDSETRRGDHGLDIPEDMLVSHCYGLLP